MKDWPNTSTGIRRTPGESGLVNSSPNTGQDSYATKGPASIAQLEPSKPKGLFRTILHKTGKGLSAAGASLVRIALSNLGAMSDN